MTPHEQRRIAAAAAGKSAPAFPTTRMFVAEDPNEFRTGHVVVADGSERRMIVMKIVTGFAQCQWYEKSGVHADIFHTSLLTMSPDQNWLMHD